MSDIILQTRITPRLSTEKIIYRERLVNLLSENIRKNLILICAAAGYGKTTLVQDFLLRKDLQSAWYQVSSDADNIYTFLSYIIHSLRRLNGKFGDNTLQFMKSARQEFRLPADVKELVNILTAVFINDFCENVEGDTILVIDDLHNAGNPGWLTPFFNKLLEDIPRNLHIIITSREVPGFNVGGPASKRKLFQLNAENLYFTQDEIGELLSKVYMIVYKESDLVYLEKTFKGWIAGIHLMVQAGGGDFAITRKPDEQLPGGLFNFFANEIFNRLEKKLQDFLLDTSLMERFDEELCSTVLKLPDSRKLIAELINRNVFIQTYAADMTVTTQSIYYYSYYQLFREFLLMKVKELRTESEIRDFNMKLCEYHRDRRDYPSAIRYLLISEEYGTAIPLIKNNFKKIYTAGGYEAILSWLKNIPERIIQAEPYLLYCKTLIHMNFSGELKESLSFIERAIELSENNSGNEFLTDCSVLRARIQLLLGNTKAVEKDMNKILKIKTTKENYARTLYCLALAHFLNAEFEKCTAALNPCLETAAVMDLPDTKADALNLLGNVYLVMGEYLKSLYYFEQVEDKYLSIAKKFEKVISMVRLYAYSGNFQKAKDLLDEAKGLSSKFPSQIFISKALWTESQLRSCAGDYEGNLKVLEELKTMAAKSNSKYYLFYYYLSRGRSYYFLDRDAKAMESFEMSKDFMDERYSSESVDYEAAASILKNNDIKSTGTEKGLLKLYEHYKRNGEMYDMSLVGFHLSDYYFKRGINVKPLKYLQESLDISSGKDYVIFLQNEFLRKRYLFDLAAENNIEKELITHIFKNVENLESLDWLSPECRKRLSKEHEKLYDVSMSAFGGLEFKVRGKAVGEFKWIRKKSKFILAYLLLDPLNRINKDKLIDIFFGESSAKNAENIFHQSIHNIRNVLSIDYSLPQTAARKSSPKKTSPPNALTPSFVNYEDRILRLNPGYFYASDVMQFDSFYEKAFNNDTPAPDRIRSAQKALTLYKGELLKGYDDEWCLSLRDEYRHKSSRLTNFVKSSV